MMYAFYPDGDTLSEVRVRDGFRFGPQLWFSNTGATRLVYWYEEGMIIPEADFKKRYPEDWQKFSEKIRERKK